MAGYAYRDDFFEYVDASAARSAAAFLARAELGFSPASVLDVGCGRGRGWWLSAAAPENVAPLAWRARCALLRMLPAPAIDAMARALHRIRS